MKINTIKKILNAKFTKWKESLPDSLKEAARRDTIITGGCIVSMLLREEINDFDIYFRTQDTASAMANHYVNQFNTKHQTGLKVDVSNEGRVRIVTENGKRGDTAGDVEMTEPGEIEDTYVEAETKALETKSEDPEPYKAVFLSTNAITLSGKIQLVIRFHGEPDQIHENYDYVHCTSYWTSQDNTLVLRKEALESILSKELRYVGSKYPICSVMRLRKFIARGWTVNAGQVLKMMIQAGELDLKDPKVLEDQLTGVDSAYFIQLIHDIQTESPEKISAGYLCEIINRLF